MTHDHVREASHAGTWYTGNGDALSGQLRRWLAEASEDLAADPPPAPAGARLRAVIAPHAGYAYSGPTAAYAYAAVKPWDYSRVIVLGPSHHYYLPDECQVSISKSLEVPGTPAGLTTDLSTVDELRKTGLFDPIDKSVEEAEHSIEMHLPYVAEVFREHPIGVVCVLVGALSETAERTYGAALAPFLNDKRTLVIASSDFCHFGSRFRYTPQPNPPGTPLYQHIEALDRQGMSLIETRDANGFATYLRATRNTICGRHPIAVLMRSLEGEEGVSIRFVRYAQSSRCQQLSDSSVSYASAWVQG